MPGGLTGGPRALAARRAGGEAAEANMDKTPHLKLPYLAPAQAQKHVTVNESLAELDGLVHCAVKEMGRDAPPASAVEGDRYLVGAAPTGAWGGKAGRLAQWRNGGWIYSAPRPGWRVYDLGTDAFQVLDAAGIWKAVGGGAPSEVQNATRIGLGTTATAENPFAAKLNAALWTARPPAEGGTGDLFLTCNKSSAGRDAGHVFQTGFVTRAIAGLFGSNRFRIAVSADGTAFNDAISVDEATGVVDLPRLPRFKAYANVDVFCPLETWTKVAVNMTEANDQGAFNPANNRFTAPAAGLYAFGASMVFKANAGATTRMRGRLAVNGSTEVRGSFGEISSAHQSGATALWLQAATPLAEDDTVELQAFFRQADGYLAANHTTFWGFKIG
jgi:hypothetical protein